MRLTRLTSLILVSIRFEQPISKKYLRLSITVTSHEGIFEGKFGLLVPKSISCHSVGAPVDQLDEGQETESKA